MLLWFSKLCKTYSYTNEEKRKENVCHGCSHTAILFGPMYGTAGTDQFLFQLPRGLKLGLFRQEGRHQSIWAHRARGNLEEISLLVNHCFSLKTAQETLPGVAVWKKQLQKMRVDKRDPCELNNTIYFNSVKIQPSLGGVILQPLSADGRQMQWFQYLRNKTLILLQGEKMSLNTSTALSETQFPVQNAAQFWL